MYPRRECTISGMLKVIVNVTIIMLYMCIYHFQFNNTGCY